MPKITWNDQVKLIIADLDDTIAEAYLPAEPAMIHELTKLLEEKRVLFIISGQGSQGICTRVTDFLPARLRQQVIIGTCSGTEVWGFNKEGELRATPYYSLYLQRLDETKRIRFREIIQQLIQEFRLIAHPMHSREDLARRTEGNPLGVGLDDRDSQITLVVKNAYSLSEEQVKSLNISIPLTHGHYDLRQPIIERAEVLLEEAEVLIVPRKAGVSSIDFAVKGVSKTTAVHYILENEEILAKAGLETSLKQDPVKYIEIWGDKFSVKHGGTDRHICEALPKKVRAIDFREEDREEFLPGYRIVLWDGKDRLEKGLLEFLQGRPAGISSL